LAKEQGGLGVLLKRPTFWVGLIVLLGLGLRLFQVGEDSFWFDEAGVANSASAATLSGAIEKAAEHAAAMPLDYVIAWGMARVSLNEGWMRLPSVLWGTLTLLASAVLFRKLVGDRAAVIGTLLLALSPMHVYFSQELRFYSPLVFFYVLLTYCMLSALQHPHWKSWGLVVLVSTVGAYFHIYVLLAWLNGGLWLLFKAFGTEKPKQSWGGLIIAGVFTGALVLPGFLIFGREGVFTYELSFDFLAGYVMAGLGWFPNYASRPGFLLGFLCLILYFLAFWTALRSKQRPLLALVVTTFLQVGLIIAADVASSYFFASRQFVLLLPFTYLMIGWIVNRLFEHEHPLFKSRSKNSALVKVEVLRRFHRSLASGVVLVLIIASGLTLLNDYSQPKNHGRQISQALHVEWQPGDTVWVIPNWEPLLYQFYLEKYLGDERFLEAFRGITWDQLSIIPEEGNGFLITQPLETYAQLDQIESLGFVPHPQLGQLDSGTQILWLRRK
jgi:uncharacterized membrane protein